MDMEALKSRLLERAQTLGLVADTPEASIEAVLAHDVQVPEPTEEECRRAYAREPQRYGAQAIAEVDHILFAVTDATPIDLLRARAELVLMRLHAEPVGFEAAAREYSNCPSGELGGNLGQLTREGCAAEFWQAIEQFGTDGLLPTLVHTRFGLHIVRVRRFIGGMTLPFEQVSQRVAQSLTQRAFLSALRAYAGDLSAETAG